MSWLPTGGEKMGHISRIKWGRLTEFIQILLWDVHPVGLNIYPALHEKSNPNTGAHWDTCFLCVITTLPSTNGLSVKWVNKSSSLLLTAIHFLKAGYKVVQAQAWEQVNKVRAQGYKWQNGISTIQGYFTVGGYRPYPLSKHFCLNFSHTVFSIKKTHNT